MLCSGGTQPAVLPCLQQQFPEKFRCDQEIHDIVIQETLELPATANTQSLGELLLQFLHYYNNFKSVVQQLFLVHYNRAMANIVLFVSKSVS